MYHDELVSPHCSSWQNVYPTETVNYAVEFGEWLNH